MSLKFTTSQKNYNGIDIMKFIMAMTIMFAHICSENVEVHPYFKTVTSVYNFGVPFFFACSGFLFFLKHKTQNTKNQWINYIKFTKRILLMYLVWSIIYFCFVFTTWVQDGVGIEIIMKYFHTALVFTTYGTIWFLPSLWIGVSIVFFLFRIGLNTNQLLIIAVFAYLIGSLGYSYFSLVEGYSLANAYDAYKAIFITTRNGVFSGFPFVMIGVYIALKGVKGNTRSNLLLTVLFSSLFIVEAVMIKYKMHANVDMGIMLIPSIYFMLSWLIQIKLREKHIYLRLRNLSMLIFLSQRLFITAIPSVLPNSFFVSVANNPYTSLFGFVLLIVIFSLLIEFASQKYKWLKILW